MSSPPIDTAVCIRPRAACTHETSARALARKERARHTSHLLHRERVEYNYVPTKLILKEKFSGQQLAIFSWLTDHRKGGTIAEISAGLRTAGFKEGKQSAEKVVAFYMHQWLKRKLLDRN